MLEKQCDERAVNAERIGCIDSLSMGEFLKVISLSRESGTGGTASSLTWPINCVSETASMMCKCGILLRILRDDLRSSY